MFHKFDTRYKYDITFYQIKIKAELTRPRWPEAELTRGPRWKQAELIRFRWNVFSSVNRRTNVTMVAFSYETGSMTGILWQLKWESLKKSRKDNRLTLLYKGLKGKASVPTDDLIPKTMRARNQHSMAFQTPIAYTDVYKGSFFPQTIRDWNALPDSLFSSAEDAEDCVAKFTSLMRAREKIPDHRSWWVIVVSAFHQ